MITTDHHANIVGEIRTNRLRKLKHTGITEFLTGPVATKTFGRGIDETVGSPGAHSPILTQFFKPFPPAGLGLPCANLDVCSNGQVDATPKKLTVRLRDIDGNPVKDRETGPACEAVTIKARR